MSNSLPPNPQSVQELFDLFSKRVEQDKINGALVLAFKENGTVDIVSVGVDFPRSLIIQYFIKQLCDVKFTEAQQGGQKGN